MKLKRRLSEKPPLSYAEESALRKEKATLEDVKDEVEIRQGLSHELHDEKAVDDRLRKINDLLERSADRDLSRGERDALEKREKLLREHLLKRNPSWKEHTRLRPSDGVIYTDLVDRIRKNNEDPAYQRLVQEWKGIRRLLDPENPRAADTRYLMRQ